MGLCTHEADLALFCLIYIDMGLTAPQCQPQIAGTIRACPNLIYLSQTFEVMK